MVGENTSRFLPPAAASAILTASAGSQLRNVTPAAGVASPGWWVRTKIGPCQAPPYGRLPSMAWSQPFRPPRMAPVVSMDASCGPGRTETPAIQSISWSGPATNPSRYIAKWKSAFPSAVCGSVSLIGRLRVICLQTAIGRPTLGHLVVDCNQFEGEVRVGGASAVGLSDQCRGRGVRRQLEPARAAGRDVRQSPLLPGAAGRLRGGDRLQHPGRPAEAAGQRRPIDP